MEGCGAAEGNSKPYKPFSPTQYIPMLSKQLKLRSPTYEGANFHPWFSNQTDADARARQPLLIQFFPQTSARGRASRVILMDRASVIWVDGESGDGESGGLFLTHPSRGRQVKR